jgi:hypothetical protein
MKKFSFSLLLTVLMLTLAVSGTALGASTGAISASDYKAGDTVTIEGSIDPGQDLYITIAQKTLFAPKDTTGSHEVKRLAKDAKKANFSEDTAIPPLFYVITTNPGAFGKEGKKRFGGPSVLLGKGNGIYSTTMFYLNKQFSRHRARGPGHAGSHQDGGAVEFSPVCQRVRLRDQHHRQRGQQCG